MTKSSRWLLAGALASFAALSACGAKGNSGNSGTSGSGGPPVSVACLGQAFSGACDSCIQASCASALGTLGSDCSDYVDCYCPNGAYNAAAQMSQSCLSKVTANPSCVSAVQTVNSCVDQNCTTPCQSGAGTGGSSGGGSGGTGGSGGGNGLTAACGVAFTTETCAGCVMSQCCSATKSCAADQGCIGIITCIHGCKNSMTCEQSCIMNAPAKAQMELSNAAQCWSSSCGNSGC